MGRNRERARPHHAGIGEGPPRPAPKSKQSLHAHPISEQVYVIVRGRGVMTVAGEEQEVQPGTMVFIPPGAEHALFNPGDETLLYISATAPPFEMPTGDLAYRPPDARG